MCGVVGVIKEPNEKFTSEDYTSFLQMLELAESRGMQATGCFYQFTDGTVKIIKTDAKASLVVDYIPMLSNVRAMVGHTRASTGGMPANNENNHPHEAGNWVLVHNGICSSSLPKNMLKLETMCDTEEFVQTFRHFEEVIEIESLEKLFQKSFELISGSWTLCFANRKTNRLYLTTNGKSPLHCMFTDTGFMFASEEGFIKNTVAYNNAIESVENGTDSHNKFFSIHLPNGEDGETFVPFSPSKNKVFDITVPSRATVVSEYTFDESYSYGSWRDYGDSYGDYGYGGYHGHRGSSYRRQSNTNTSGNVGKPKIDNAKSKYKNKDFDKTIDVEEYYRVDNLLGNNPLTFDCTDIKLYDSSDEDKETLQRYALEVLGDMPDAFGLTPRQALRVVRAYNQGHVNLTKKIRGKITKAFAEAFATILYTYIDEHGLDYVNFDAWILLDGDNLDKASNEVCKEFPWWYAVIAVYQGLELMSNVLFEEQGFSQYQVDKRFNELPDSSYACAHCKVKRKVVDEGGFKSYVCPSCQSEFIMPN